MGTAFLIKPKVSLFREFLLQVGGDYKVLDFDYKIYVPGVFVFGNFKKRDDGFKLSKRGIFYRDSSETLKKYSEFLSEDKMEVVRDLVIPVRDLEKLKYMSREYLHARENISGLAGALLE